MHQFFQKENNSCNAADSGAFRCMDKQYIKLRTSVPREFHDLAKRFKIEPDHLAFSILDYFAEHPEKLCLVSRDPSRARRDTPPL